MMLQTTEDELVALVLGTVPGERGKADIAGSSENSAPARNGNVLGINIDPNGLPITPPLVG